MRPVRAIQIFYMQNTVCNVCGFDGLNALENYVVLKHQIGWGQGLGQGCTVSSHTLCVTTIDHNKACLQSGPLVSYHHATQPPFIVKVASLDKGFCREFLVACPCPPGALHEVLAADPRQGWVCPGKLPCCCVLEAQGAAAPKCVEDAQRSRLAAFSPFLKRCRAHPGTCKRGWDKF